LDHARHALLSWQVNLLLLGNDEETGALLKALRPHLPPPLHEARNAAGLSLPDGAGTLILRGLSRLASQEQQALFTWLDSRAGRIQVVSMNEEPVFPLVEQGAFLPELYYRLNIVILLAGEIRADVLP
jgi:hypothetical protein